MPTLKLIATNVDYKAIPDPGTELGDRQIFTDDLRKKESDPPIGTHSAVCARPQAESVALPRWLEPARGRPHGRTAVDLSRPEVHRRDPWGD
jgi:hypothetical protein